jgi:carbon storage regulator
MLVLTRRVGESLVIDGTIRVTVLAVNGGKIRLGFEAPPSVSVLRGEVFLREQGGAGEVARPEVAAGSGTTR